ncbi:MAG TPA: hypothetical protein VN728_14375 [Stellaceae bacterium]|nr:hypothetical protein [Stellaceae bacterium]
MAMIVGSIVLSIGLLAGFVNAYRPWVGELFGILGVFEGGYIVANVLKSRLILYADRIEDHGPLKTKILQRKDIGGKVFFFAGAPTYSLIPRSKHQRKMLVQIVFRPDR